jgi:hypothetical protein
LLDVYFPHYQAIYIYIYIYIYIIHSFLQENLGMATGQDHGCLARFLATSETPTIPTRPLPNLKYKIIQSYHVRQRLET